MKIYLDVLFENIKKLKILKNFFESFYKLTGLSIDIMDKEGKYYQVYYNPPIFCKTIQSSKESIKACISCDREYGLLLSQKREPVIFTCHAGITAVAVPIIINNEYIGGLGVGSILANRHSEKEFQNIYSKVKHLNINKPKLRKAYFNTLVMSEEKLKGCIDFVQLIVNYIIEIEDKIFLLEKTIEDSAVISAKVFMKENYNESLTLKDIAKSVFLSPYYFAHLFKKETGITPLQYITELRINRAKKLLKHSKTKVIEICDEVGYRSLPYFNKIFKKNTGVTPTEYRISPSKK